jgi:hypothetical protein
MLSLPLTWCSPAGPWRVKFGIRLRKSPVIRHCQYPGVSHLWDRTSRVPLSPLHIPAGGIGGELASSLRAIGVKYRHLWPAITEHPAAAAAARHGHTRRKREHPGRIPPAVPGPARGMRENKPRDHARHPGTPAPRKLRNTRPREIKTFSGLASWVMPVAPPGGRRHHRDLSVAISPLSRYVTEPGLFTANRPRRRISWLSRIRGLSVWYMVWIT